MWAYPLEICVLWTQECFKRSVSSVTKTIVTTVPFVNIFVEEFFVTAVKGPLAETDVAPEGTAASSRASAGAARPMRADAIRNHEKILIAAEETFALEGVLVPIDVIAERAGVGIGTLYRHFPTKEALYEAIVTTRVTHLIETARSYESDADPGHALFSFLRQFAQQAAAKRDLFEALNQAGIDVKSQFSDLLSQLMSTVDVLRERAVAVGAIKDDVSTTDILTLISGSCHAAGHNGVDNDALQRLLDIVIAGICQPVAR